MADERTTLLDIAKANGADATAGLIEEAAKATPEIIRLPARPIRGTNFKTLVRTGVPVAGFRGANEGTDAVKSTWINRLVEAFILNPRWECDKAVADAYEDGAEAWIAMEASGILQGSLIALATQFYYGISGGGHAKGFPGLVEVYDSTNMAVDAGGTTGSTGSSVWGVKFGPQDVQLVVGQGGDIAVSDVRTETILDDASKKLTAYVQELQAWVGLQVGSVYSVGRIKKLTADDGKGLTDDLVADMLDLFPIGKKPDVLFMSRRSRGQLRKSRTAVNATGAPAPIPLESHGIPIEATDAIVDTEELTL
jgi:hypothetical protein